MAPWYMKKKVWVAILTAAAQIVAGVTNNPELGEKILYVGSALILALGLEDMGKAAPVVEAQVRASVAPPPSAPAGGPPPVPRAA
jgi:hypothetical protein